MKDKAFKRAVLEALTFTKPRRRRAVKEEIRIEDIDLAELYLTLESRADKIKKSKEAIEKLMKKEEKKPDAKTNIATLALWLVASFPITGPLYFLWLAKTFKAAGF